MFNEFYGLKDYFFNINEYLDNHKEYFLDENKTQQAIIDFSSELNDPHTAFSNNSFLYGIYDETESERITDMYDTYRTVASQTALRRLNDETAVIPFNSFVIDDIDDSFYDMRDTARRIYIQLVKYKDEGVKNIVFDVSLNGGGDSFSLAQILGFITNDDIVYELKNTKTKRIKTEKYKIDADYDGDFNDNDAFDFNYYVLSSGYSFSCANIFINYCKMHNLAKIIGEKSGGGACAIYLAMLPVGTTLQLSGLSGFYNSNDELIELGVDVDYIIPTDKLRDKNSILEAIDYFSI